MQKYLSRCQTATLVGCFNNVVSMVSSTAYTYTRTATGAPKGNKAQINLTTLLVLQRPLD
jgi:hypothetical protein